MLYVPWLTWAWVSVCCHILAALQICPDVTEKWNDSMKTSQSPWQPERFLVLAASKFQDKHWLNCEGMRQDQGCAAQEPVLFQKCDPKFFTQMKWSRVCWEHNPVGLWVIQHFPGQVTLMKPDSLHYVPGLKGGTILIGLQQAK